MRWLARLAANSRRGIVLSTEVWLAYWHRRVCLSNVWQSVVASVPVEYFTLSRVATVQPAVKPLVILLQLLVSDMWQRGWSRDSLAVDFCAKPASPLPCYFVAPLLHALIAGMGGGRRRWPVSTLESQLEQHKHGDATSGYHW